jgi:salicylate 5-hydroxylase small subunit
MNMTPSEDGQRRPDRRHDRAPRAASRPRRARAELDALDADYAAALDEARYDDWIALFADDCRYTLQPRENFDRGLPLATLAFESKGMPRGYGSTGTTRTMFHAPDIKPAAR